jgi:hypothetical protein
MNFSERLRKALRSSREGISTRGLRVWLKIPFAEKALRFFLVLAVLAPALTTAAPPSFAQQSRTEYSFPGVPSAHTHMRLLLENAFRYVDPVHGIVDPVSGYPAEGWNQEPRNGLYLRSFTQLTAIGEWVELLANIVAGYADNPCVSKESAMNQLSLAVRNLLEDQENPSLAAKGLLVNFLGLEGGKRAGPLLESIERSKFTGAFGDQTGHAIWQALVKKGWILEEDNGRKGRIRRGEKYGAAFFDGALAPYATESLKSRIMRLLDRRVVTIIFGDNANLTASVAKSVGALLRPEIRNDPKVAGLREEMERFIRLQKDGYSHLFNPKTGTFFFGWDATADRFVGWDDGRGNWITGQMNYFINEFRGPWIFTVLRYALPVASIRNAGFRIKPYRYSDGRGTSALAAWDGSAFQLLGLSLFMQELRNPSWRGSLETLVDIELDFSGRRSLPGFLSEAYSGNGTEYTGLIGISDLALTDKPLITHAPSLYTLGVAYTIAPEKVERFLKEHWPMISRLFTDHGPWEGWNTLRNAIIPYQTTVHTLSLILGGIGSAQENMYRYLEQSNLSGALERLYESGDRMDLLRAENRVIPWTSDQSRIEFKRESGSCRFTSRLAGIGGMAFRVPEDRTLNLANGRLFLRYRLEGPRADGRISFKRANDDPLPPPAIPIEITIPLIPTKEEEVEVILPATPALGGIREISLTFGVSGTESPLDLSLTAFEFIPFGVALDPGK